MLHIFSFFVSTQLPYLGTQATGTVRFDKGVPTLSRTARLYLHLIYLGRF
jgi:hypothetical protein